MAEYDPRTHITLPRNVWYWIIVLMVLSTLAQTLSLALRYSGG